MAFVRASLTGWAAVCVVWEVIAVSMWVPADHAYAGSGLSVARGEHVQVRQAVRTGPHGPGREGYRPIPDAAVEVEAQQYRADNWRHANDLYAAVKACLRKAPVSEAIANNGRGGNRVRWAEGHIAGIGYDAEHGRVRVDKFLVEMNSGGGLEVTQKNGVGNFHANLPRVRPGLPNVQLSYIRDFKERLKEQGRLYKVIVWKYGYRNGNSSVMRFPGDYSEYRHPDL